VNIRSQLRHVAPVYVQQQRFQAMSDTIIGRIDEMGNRIEDLEKSINELMENASKPLPELEESGADSAPAGTK
jgi:heat shock factor-binding protein 1